MIISHKHKFIFIKTNKTAGTSIEIALSKFCGADDIITPISPEDEEIRKELGYMGPQNYLAAFWEYSPLDLTKLFLKKKRKMKYYNHISAEMIKTQIGEQVWNSYFKFCFERNPWDRVISLYYWRTRSKPTSTLSAFIDSETPKDLKSRGYDLYTINGEIVVDKVCLYENINKELEEIYLHLDLPEKLVLPQAKSRFRTDKRPYYEVLGSEDRKKISNLFSEEIRRFAYESHPSNR